MKPVKFMIKLRDGERPDVSVLTIKKMIENDTYVHPAMERTLKLLKKTRQAYIRLPILKEMILDLDNHVTYEHPIKPENNAWTRNDLCPEEITDYEKDPDGYIKRIQEMYEKYLKSSFYDLQDVTQEELDRVDRLTKTKKGVKKMIAKTKQPRLKSRR